MANPIIESSSLPIDAQQTSASAVTYPAGSTVDDIILLITQCNIDPDTWITSPEDAGFTRIENQRYSGAGSAFRGWTSVYWKAGGDVGTFDIETAFFGNIALGIIRISGASPIDYEVAWGEDVDQTEHQAPDLVTTKDEGLILRIVGSCSELDIDGADVPATNLWTSSAAGPEFSVSWENQAAAGSTGQSGDFGVDGSFADRLVGTMAIFPSSGGGGSGGGSTLNPGGFDAEFLKGFALGSCC